MTTCRIALKPTADEFSMSERNRRSRRECVKIVEREHPRVAGRAASALGIRAAVDRLRTNPTRPYCQTKKAWGSSKTYWIAGLAWKPTT